MDHTTGLRARCPGTLGRRAFVSSGIGGLWSLGLADLLRMETQAAAATLPGASTPRPKSVLVLWLWGGPSHMETFDMKPEAPSEYRGDFNPIKTSAPGIEIGEHLPLLAKQAHRFSLIRSLHHDSPGHVNSTHTVLTGYPGKEVETAPYHPEYPDVWSVTNKFVGDWSRGVPPYLTLGRTRYNGGAYLGGSLDPLVVAGDPNEEAFKAPDLAMDPAFRARFQRRATLLERFEGARRDLDQAAEAGLMDSFQRKAVSVLSSDATAKAFDLRGEEAARRDRYGRNSIGQRALLGLRLVEAGARIVTVDFPCVPGQKAFSWDDHASVWNIFEQMKIRLPVLDQVVSNLIQDIYDRGLQNDVLLLVMGEMSRTPKISHFGAQPGREHWGKSMSALVAGGGMRMGQVVGSTSRLGDEPEDRPLTPCDLQATFYKYFGVPLDTALVDRTGRPIPILPHGEPIRELI